MNILRIRLILFLFPFILAAFVLIISCTNGKYAPISYQEHLIEKVPFYSQVTYQCGPASLAGVLNYWGINVTPDDIAREIFSESARGTLNIDMVLYAQRKGLKAEQYKGDIADLKKNIDSGYPIIVLVDYGFSLYQVNHYMVVAGYNEHGFIVNSGRDKTKFISQKEFMKVWERTKYWTLLIKPK